MKTVEIDEAQAHLGEYLDDTSGEPFIIVREGRTVGVVVPASEEEAERFLLSFSPKLQRLLQERAESIVREGGLSDEEFWAAVKAEGGTEAKKKTGTARPRRPGK